MILDSVKARVLASVADGLSVPEAARANGLNPNQGRSAIWSLCRHLKVSADLEAIRADPKKYRDLAASIAKQARYELRSTLRDRLRGALHLRSDNELTPDYLSNLTPEMLLNAGVTGASLGEIQEWLVTNKQSLKRRPPDSPQHVTTIKRAIFLLDAFGFDVAKAQSQLRHLEDQEE